PLSGVRSNAEHRAQLEAWLKSYEPERLFDENGAPRPEIRALAPQGARRMTATPYANGGLLLRDLALPEFRHYGVDVAEPGRSLKESTRVLGGYLRDVVRANAASKNVRVFGPDETESNRLDAIYEVTGKRFAWPEIALDEHMARDGRVLEVLSEHLCQG